MSDTQVDIVNISAGGNLNREIDIQQVANDSDLPVSRFDPDYGASFLRFEEEGELFILYPSGKYILRGGNEFENVYCINDKFLSYIAELGVEFDDPSIEIKNIVAVGNLGEDINLGELSIVLGLENIEYEPEQFPGLIYRPSNSTCVLLIFASGKVVITGGRNIVKITNAYDELEKEIHKF